MKNRFFVAKQISLVLYMISIVGIARSAAVTYDVSPGRFGDNLLGYIHAKWISFVYDLPLLYKPFVYSDALLIDELETHYEPEMVESFSQVVRLTGRRELPEIDLDSSILYIVPYFPDSQWEQDNCVGFSGGKWDYFLVDWENQDFVKELNCVIAPKEKYRYLLLPEDRLTVAVHVRRGGNHDTPCTLKGFPLKFVSDYFFIDAIKKLYLLFNETPLYVYIFTDDNDPSEIVYTYQQALQECNIQWECRETGNSDTVNVLQDYFALREFDCLIHTESNYSYTSSKLHPYLISLYPDSFMKQKNSFIYTSVKIKCSPLCSDDIRERATTLFL